MAATETLRPACSLKGQRLYSSRPSSTMSESLSSTSRRQQALDRLNIYSKYAPEDTGMKEKTNEKREEETESTPPPTPKPAWSQFSEHVKVVSRSDLFLGETKESYKSMCSDDHQKTLSVIRQMNVRKQFRTMKLRVRAVDRLKAEEKELSDSATSADETEEESEDEEEIAEREKKRAQARKHWEVIKRYVYDRTKKRRKKIGGFHKDKAFNKIKAQAKAKVNPAQTRREIFERYGIVPRPGKLYPEDTMKPTFSDKTHEIIAKFEQIQVISIHAKHRPSTSGFYLPKRTKSNSNGRIRPRTTAFGGSIMRDRFR